MALLGRKIALLPGRRQQEFLGRIRRPCELWQRRPAHTMLAASAYVLSGDRAWYKISSSCVAVVEKLDGVFLEIEHIPLLDDTGCSRLAALDAEETYLALVAEWLRPIGEGVSDAYWEQVTRNPSADEVLASTSLEGYLAWAGLLFGPSEHPVGLLHLDETPESVRFTVVPEEIAAFTDRAQIVGVRDLDAWCSRLSGWEIRLGK